MFLLLFQMDMETVPAEERSNGEVASNAMVVIGFLLLWSSLQTAMNSEGGANVPLIFLSVGSFVMVAVIYYLGLLVPYKRTQRNLKKRMKGMPEVPSFDEWNKANPARAEKPKSGKKRR